MNLWSIGIKILLGGVVVAILVVLYNLIGDYWRNPQRWNGSAMSYYTHVGTLQVDSAKVHREKVQLDSVNRQLDSANVILLGTIQTAESNAKTYQNEKDSLRVVVENAIGRMSYLEQVSDLFQRLYRNGTLARPAVGTPGLILTDSVVVLANVKTAADLDIEKTAGAKLQISVGVRDARILQLRAERRAKNRAIAGAGRVVDNRLQRVSKGFVRKVLNRPQIKALRVVRDSLKKAEVTGESELEKIENRKQQL